MKKTAVLGVAIAVSFLLAACGGAPAAGGSGNATGGGTPAAAPEAGHSVDELGRIFSAAIEETVLFDDQGVKITAKELSYTDYSAELQLLLENNSDRDLTFLSNTIGYAVNSVNGYMMPIGYLSEDIAAGMSAAQTVTMELDMLSMYGILDIADVSLGFEIKAGDEDYLKTGPLEVKTFAAAGYDYSKDTFKEAMDGMILPAAYGFSVDYRGTDTLLDENGVTIGCEYVITNKDGEKKLFLEAVNNSDQNLYVSSEDVSVNGMNVSSGTWSSEFIVAGKRALMTLDLDRLLSTEAMDLLGMKKYTDCSMLLEVLDENWNVLGSKEAAIAFDGTSSPDGFAGDVVYDSNGYTFQTVGLAPDSYDFSDDVHVLALMKNTSGQAVYVSTGFGDVYVNKMKVMDITYGRSVKDGGYALIDISLTGYDLEDNGLDISTITEVTAEFQIGDGNYHYYDEPTITMTF